jgi:hypothetical protein
MVFFILHSLEAKQVVFEPPGNLDRRQNVTNFINRSVVSQQMNNRFTHSLNSLHFNTHWVRHFTSVPDLRVRKKRAHSCGTGKNKIWRNSESASLFHSEKLTDHAHYNLQMSFVYSHINPNRILSPSHINPVHILMPYLTSILIIYFHLYLNSQVVSSLLVQTHTVCSSITPMHANHRSHSYTVNINSKVQGGSNTTGTICV